MELRAIRMDRFYTGIDNSRHTNLGRIFSWLFFISRRGRSVFRLHAGNHDRHQRYLRQQHGETLYQLFNDGSTSIPPGTTLRRAPI